ncbi:alpha beta hydrolase fold protein [Phlyctema vagabunda]|uniref:Alpha beta hydrolase fold protein n=1 Tax=Phlyctema vagabunda TaxID=108571 RepID=A0ABR4PX49_9HELO
MAPQVSTSTLPAPATGFFERIYFFIRLWGLQKVAEYGVATLRTFQPLPRNQQPTFTKSYAARPHLKNRIFVPRSHKPDELLPLYIDIHGGGFALCNPSFDDEFCADFANANNFLIVSLDYSKAPQSAFPTATDDIEALIHAVLEDEALPFDKNRVAIGGFSAGGNLALSAVQAPELQGKIHAVVPWYPVLEWVTTTEQKLKTRPYRNEKDVDLLEAMGPMFNYGYIKEGQDLLNPRLSVSYADKKTLPKWIFFVGAEYDMLCAEAKDMVMDLAGLNEAEMEECIYSFERGTYRWRMARGVMHGYTHNIGPETPDQVVRLQRCEETFAEVGEWLKTGPFAISKS